mgnify:CR=1 FL=1|jgi:hypothetical protein
MNNAKTTGMSFTTVLFLIFLVLKLTKTINWSWWWVTSPLWIPLVLGIILVVITLIISALR